MAELDELLEQTSRTFALAIPLLPEPTRAEVTVGYLLFRVADTFEDAHRWSVGDRVEALHRFIRLVENPRPDDARQLGKEWSTRVPIEHDGYRYLLSELPFLMEQFTGLSPGARNALARHSRRTAEGMARYVQRTLSDGSLCLSNLEELRAYCYVVAGIVGELLTELYLLGRPRLEPLRSYLQERAPRFGEALQLVNILKDVESDVREGRRFLGAQVARPQVFELAREDLRTAREYTEALQQAGAEFGLVAFNALPVLLAEATLERVEHDGPGATLTRPEVHALYQRLLRRLHDGQSAVGEPVGAPARLTLR